jgi:diadenosine tetraphosphatase ApaH/serine/threonine PP2A family protein phosphatase
MRFAIFGDIHANLHALEAVMADTHNQGCTHYICMGDLVGYNAFPKECLAIARDLDCPVVKGNHDEQVSMDYTQEGLNPLAEEALNWTRNHLDEADKQWLRELRIQRLVRDFTIAHATLDTPHKWGYVTSALDAAASFTYQHTGLCFIGHTHRPMVYVRDGSVSMQPFETIQIEKNKKYLVNVGSVGQPRDGDWRAAYCIYDTDKNELSLRRVPYDLEGAQRAILHAKLPDKLALRLANGR